MATPRKKVFFVALAALLLGGGTVAAVTCIIWYRPPEKYELLRRAEQQLEHAQYAATLVTCLEGVVADRNEPRFYKMAAEASLLAYARLCLDRRENARAALGLHLLEAMLHVDDTRAVRRALEGALASHGAPGTEGALRKLIADIEANLHGRDDASDERPPSDTVQGQGNVSEAKR